MRQRSGGLAKLHVRALLQVQPKRQVRALVLVRVRARVQALLQPVLQMKSVSGEAEQVAVPPALSDGQRLAPKGSARSAVVAAARALTSLEAHLRGQALHPMCRGRRVPLQSAACALHESAAAVPFPRGAVAAERTAGPCTCPARVAGTG